MTQPRKKLPEKLIFSIYIAVSILLLVGAVIFSIGYDNGYRIKGLSIQKTGSITMQVSEKDSWVFLGQNPIHQTTTKNERINIPNAEPGVQLITVIKDRYFPWAKRLRVPSNGELSIFPFLLRQNTEASLLTPEAKSYSEVIQYFFNPQSTPQTSYETNGLLVEATNTGVALSRLDDSSALPTIETTEPVLEVLQFRQNPNVTIYATATTIWVSELEADNRLAYQIFEGSNIRLYPKEDRLYVQSGGVYYRISF